MDGDVGSMRTVFAMLDDIRGVLTVGSLAILLTLALAGADDLTSQLMESSLRFCKGEEHAGQARTEGRA